MSAAAGSLWFSRPFDTDTHRQCTPWRVAKPTPCGAPVRAGQHRR